MPHPPFTPRHGGATVLAACIAAALPLSAFAKAGDVAFAFGPVSATGADGARRVLRKGSEINPGDTVETGRGRAQLRFTDGSYVSLRPDTEFRVDEYDYEGKPAEEQRGFFSLLRGGLRTVTGAIGRLAKRTYRMTTPVATIGIRGTRYTLELTVNERGEQVLDWAVADDGSSIITVVLPDGTEQAFSWGGEGSATRERFEELAQYIQQLADRGELDDATRERLEDIFSQAEDVLAPDGENSLLAALLETLLGAGQEPAPPPAAPVPPPDCSVAESCAIVAAWGGDGGEILGQEDFVDEFFGAAALSGSLVSGVQSDGGEGVAATFDANGGLTSYTDVDSLFPLLSDGALGTAVVVVDGSANFSVDPANPEDPRARATWGRWIPPSGGDGQTSGSFPHPLLLRQNTPDTFAYVVDIPTAELFNQGTGTYTLAGFTPPAVINGAGDGAGLGASLGVTGSLTADFGSSLVDANLNVSFVNGAYQINASEMSLSSRGFFGGAPSVQGTGIACVEGCSGNVAGNVFGPRADGAAMGYRIEDTELAADVVGATVFQQTACPNCAVVPLD